MKWYAIQHALQHMFHVLIIIMGWKTLVPNFNNLVLNTVVVVVVVDAVAVVVVVGYLKVDDGWLREESHRGLLQAPESR